MDEMKARAYSLCSLCNLTIKPGDEIQRHVGERSYYKTRVTRQWAHVKCVQAWIPGIKPDEMLDCPACHEMWRASRIADHWMDWECDGGHMMSRGQVDRMWRDLLYERLESGDG